MADYILTKNAEKEIEHFYKEGIERHGPGQADKFLVEIFDVFAMLTGRPGIGVRVIIEGYVFLRWVKRPYVIFYQVDSDDVRILRIYDARSNYMKNLCAADLQEK